MAGAANPTPGAGGGLGTGTGSLGTIQPVLDEVSGAQRDSDAPATSNAVLVDGRHTATGRPIAVFGPQVGYQMPSFLVEKDVHGPGIDARGVGFAGIDAYVLLGRGRDYAWSATSSGADNTDTFVLRLCDPSGGPATTTSMGYEHDGKCRAITTFDHTVRPATIGGGAPGSPLTWTVQRAPDYGPVVRRGTLRDGTPIAIARKRSTYGDEISSAIGFQRLNDPAVMRAGYPAFKTAAGAHIGFTFNWFYVDGVTIGYQHSCKCPLRAHGVDPDLPTLGTGKWDWTGFLAPSRQPSDVNPSRGYITSWNNKQAPGFRASDAQFSYGPVYRVQLLNQGVEQAFKTARSRGLNARRRRQADDERGDPRPPRASQVLPRLLALLTPGSEPADLDPRALDLRERLEIWSKEAGGPHRHAKTRGAPYTDPVAIAALDAWWPQVTTAVFGPSTGTPFSSAQAGRRRQPARPRRVLVRRRLVLCGRRRSVGRRGRTRRAAHGRRPSAGAATRPRAALRCGGRSARPSLRCNSSSAVPTSTRGPGSRPTTRSGSSRSWRRWRRWTGRTARRSSRSCSSGRAASPARAATRVGVAAC